MWNYEFVDSGDDYLAHYGILGMKWGVRRYQNEDGTLTSAGKKRYGEQIYGSDPLKKMRKSKPDKTYGKDPLSRRSASEMSDDELMADNKRQALEKQYNKNHPKEASKLESGKEIVDATNQAVRNLRDLNRTAANSHKKTNTKDLSNMTDDELRKQINRKNLERQYNDLFSEPDTIDAGHAQVDEILSTTGSVLAIGSSALSIALAIQRLRKG